MTAQYVPFADGSHWQGNWNFQTLKARGVQGVLLKVSQGHTADPKFLTYARDAKAAGLWVGGYLFLDVTSTATPQEQADLFVSQVRAAGTTMLHMYDCEWDGGPVGLVKRAVQFVARTVRPKKAAAKATAAANHRVTYYRDVMGRIDTALGRKGSIYTIKSFWRDYCQNADFTDHDLIVAAPLNGMPPTDASAWDDWAAGRGPTSTYWPVGQWTTWGGWQFAVPPGSGPTYGAESTAIDMDLCDPTTFARWTGQLQPGDDDMGAPFALISAGGVNYAVASDLQSKLGLNPSALKGAQALLALSGFGTSVLVASGDILNLVNSIPLTTDDATAAQVATVGTAVTTGVAAIQTHLGVQDTNIGKIPTTQAPPGSADVNAILQGTKDLLNKQTATTTVIP